MSLFWDLVGEAAATENLKMTIYCILTSEIIHAF